MINSRVAGLPTAEDVSFWHENGYWIGPAVIDAAEVEACRAAMEEVYAGVHQTGVSPTAIGWLPGDDPAALRKTDNAWLANQAIRRVTTNALIGACAAGLMEAPTIKLWQDQLLYKPPGGPVHQAIVGWHQDWFYWCGAADQPRLLTAWVALDDVDERNGAMQVVPGSHRWGLVDELSDFFSPDAEGQMEMMRHRGDFREPISLNMRAGQASYHHCLTVHGSAPNHTDRPRRSLAVHLMAGDIRAMKNDVPQGVHYNAHFFREAGGTLGEEYTGAYWPTVHPPVSERVE